MVLSPLFTLVLLAAPPEAVNQQTSPPTIAAESPAAGETTEQAKTRKTPPKPTPPPVHEEIQVTATRYETDTFQTPVPISIVSSDDISRLQPEKMVDLLKQLPDIDVSGEGPFRGLPVIRGMSSNRVLILVDGQRLNNARESTQFAGIQPGLVDLSVVDRIEVVRGPSSVLYGSDAIGGVINIITKQQAFHQGPLTLGGTAGYEYGTAADSQRGHVDLNGAGERTTFHLGASAFEAKDYKSPDGTVPNSGMKQRSFDGNLRFLLGQSSVLRLDTQITQTRDVGFPGYDPATSGIDIAFPRFDRNKVGVTYETGPFGGLGGLSVSAYYQGVTKESRLNFDFPGYFLHNFTRSEINTVGANAQSSATLGANAITFGVDFYQDRLHDSTLESDPYSSSTDVAVPDSDQRGLGLYAQDQIAATDKLQLVAGVRGDRYSFVSKNDSRYTGTPFDVSETAFSGNVSARYQVTDNVALTALVGRGFRAPNIQERAYFGYSSDGTAYIEQNPNLKPETSLNAELGFKVRYSRYSGGFNVYRNKTRDFIDLVYDGKYDGTTLDLTQFRNIDRATIQGVEFELETFLSQRWTVFTNVSYSRGTDDATGDPLGLIAPLKGVVGIRYQRQQWWGEAGSRMVASNTRVAQGYTATPGFATIDLRGGYEFADGIRVEASLANLGDVAYHEPFNTRLEPGRNFKLSLGYKF